jgi:hypothetical protein
MQMSNSNTGPSVPPGWYPDPSGTGRLRWWDGTNWTSQYSTPYLPPVQAAGPAGGAPYPATPYIPERPQISSETPVYNPLIWIITLLPLLPVILLLLWNPELRFISIGRQDTPAVDPLSIFTPVYFLLVFSGFLTYAASVLLAYFDSERLKRDGVVRPFHWAWSFINSAVYVIGRSVIVHKVAPGRGLVPVWATIGVFVLSSVVSTVKISALVSSVMSSVMSIPN